MICQGRQDPRRFALVMLKMHSRLQLQASCSPRCTGSALVLPARISTRPRAHTLIRCATTPSEVSQPIAEAQQPQQQQGDGWDYKYPHLPCSSPCASWDIRCKKVEALFQHVLGHPRLPVRVCSHLSGMPTDIDAITNTVEGLAKRFGKELVLYFIKRSPAILMQDLDAAVSASKGLHAHGRSFVRVECWRSLSRGAMRSMQPAPGAAAHSGIHEACIRASRPPAGVLAKQPGPPQGQASMPAELTSSSPATGAHTVSSSTLARPSPQAAQTNPALACLHGPLACHARR